MSEPSEPSGPNLCKLHFGLYVMAKKNLTLEYDPEAIADTIFAGQDPGVENMINFLIGIKLLEVEGNVIHLPAWPRGKSRSMAKKSECLLEPRHPVNYNPAEDHKDKDFNYADFAVFMQNYPAEGSQENKRQKRTAAVKQWRTLARMRLLPPLNVVLTALQKFPPKTGMTGAGTWLKKKPWESFWTPAKAMSTIIGACKICLDHGYIIQFNEVTGEKERALCKCRIK